MTGKKLKQMAQAQGMKVYRCSGRWYVALKGYDYELLLKVETEETIALAFTDWKARNLAEAA